MKQKTISMKRLISFMHKFVIENPDAKKMQKENEIIVSYLKYFNQHKNDEI